MCDRNKYANRGNLSVVVILLFMCSSTLRAQEPAVDPGDSADGSEKPIGQEPSEDISRLFLRDSEVLLKPREIQLSAGLSYSKTDTRDNFRLSRGRQLSVPLNLSAGLANNLEFFGTLPMVYVSRELVSLNDSQKSDKFSIGDSSLGLSYQLWPESGSKPSLTGSFAVSLPTGKEANPIDLNELSTGSGLWGVSGGFSITRSVDPAVLFLNFGYQHVFSDQRFGAKVQPGDSFSYGYGAGLSINSAVSFSGRVSGSYQLETKLNDERVPGSGIEPVSLAITMTQLLGNKRRLETSLGYGLNEEAGDLELGFTYIWNL